MSLSINIGRPFLNDKTLDEQARSILRLYGTNAHVYLPGANGVAISGLNSGNYVESTFSTLANVDSVVGGVRDPVGSIDATQATTANKPMLNRGLYNLALRSNAVNDAAWTKNGTATTPSANTVNLPADGTDFLNNTTALTTVASSPYTVVAMLSGTGTVRIGSNSSGVTSTIVTLTATPTLYVHNFTTGGVSTYILPVYRSGTTATSVTVDGIGFFQGTLTAAQILAEGGIALTTSTAASNSGAGRYSWKFDGGNDSLLTGNLAITNAACITIAGRLDSLAATSVLFGEDTGGVSISVATNGAVSFDKLGTGALVTSSAGLIVAGTSFVLTCRLSGGTAVIRKNGAQSATSASGSTFAATTGARLGGTFAGASYCTGALSQVDVIVGAVTDADALTLERNAASNLVAGPTF